MATGVKQQQRRGLAADWNISNHVLDEGELGVTTDTGIIKIGDGVNGWNDLPAAFGSAYLPMLGKAADSELLDGIDSSGFLKTGDATTTATADKVARRTADGRILAANGTTGTEVVNYAQMIAGDNGAVVSARRINLTRTVTADFTLAATDDGGMIFVNGPAWGTTIVCNVPTNASVPISIGSVIELRTATTAQSPMNLVPAGGVTIAGLTLIHGQASHMRIAKTGTDNWVVISVNQSPGPVLHRKIKQGADNTLTTGSFVKLRLDGVNGSGASHAYTNNYDSLGTNVQYNSGSDLYKIYARRSGWYNVSVQAVVETNNNGRLYFQTKINGALCSFGGGAARANGPHMMHSLTGGLPLNVGDYLEFELYLEGGTGTQVMGEDTYASSFVHWSWDRSL